MTVTDFLNDWKYYGKIKRTWSTRWTNISWIKTFGNPWKQCVDFSPIYLEYGACIKMYGIIPTILTHKQILLINYKLSVNINIFILDLTNIQYTLCSAFSIKVRGALLLPVDIVFLDFLSSIVISSLWLNGHFRRLKIFFQKIPSCHESLSSNFKM